MKIVSFEAQNIKRLKAIRIKPDGSLVVIGGQNAAGKSTVLDCIMYALEDKASQPGKPVREGASKGFVKLDLGDLVVKRTMTAGGGGGLKVKSKSGKEYPGGTPQAILDKLMSKVSFDPLEFSRMKPAEHASVLRELVGIDTTKLDAKRQGLYDERTGAGRQLKKLQGQLAGLPEALDDVPEEEVSVSGLAENLLALNLRNDKRDVLASSVGRAGDAVDLAKENLERAKMTLAGAHGDLVIAKEEASHELGKLPGGSDREPTEPITDAMEKAEETNRLVRAKKEREQLEGDVEDSETDIQCLTDDIQKIDDAKAQTIAEAEFPIEGLGITEDIVTYNGIPFDQASSAEQLRVSTAIGLASNPVLKVLRIYDGSLLDEDNLKILGEMAEAADAQVWIERVGTGDEVSVIIEDGEVVEGDAG